MNGFETFEHLKASPGSDFDASQIQVSRSNPRETKLRISFNGELVLTTEIRTYEARRRGLRAVRTRLFFRVTSIETMSRMATGANAHRLTRFKQPACQRNNCEILASFFSLLILIST